MFIIHFIDVVSMQGHKNKYESYNQNTSYSLPLKAKRKLFDRNSLSPIVILEISNTTLFYLYKGYILILHCEII